jgi:AcrR family transcriptional regulator
VSTEQRPKRADAVRNRAKIINSARNQISVHGVDVGMDEIAHAAGVAVGTLYRHFPTKTDLVAAVVAEYVDATAVDAEASLRRAQGGEAEAVDELVGYVRRVNESSADHVAVKATARSLGLDAHADTSSATRIAAALAELIARGQAAGDIRPEVTVDDLFLLLTTAPIDRAPEVRGRWLALVLRGITTR